MTVIDQFNASLVWSCTYTSSFLIRKNIRPGIKAKKWYLSIASLPYFSNLELLWQKLRLSYSLPFFDCYDLIATSIERMNYRMLLRVCTNNYSKSTTSSRPNYALLPQVGLDVAATDVLSHSKANRHADTQLRLASGGSPGRGKTWRTVSDYTMWLRISISKRCVVSMAVAVAVERYGNI